MHKKSSMNWTLTHIISSLSKSHYLKYEFLHQRRRPSRRSSSSRPDKYIGGQGLLQTSDQSLAMHAPYVQPRPAKTQMALNNWAASKAVTYPDEQRLSLACAGCFVLSWPTPSIPFQKFKMQNLDLTNLVQQGHVLPDSEIIWASPWRWTDKS